MDKEIKKMRKRIERLERQLQESQGIATAMVYERDFWRAAANGDKVESFLSNHDFWSSEDELN